MVAVTIERPRTGVVATLERWVYESPLWVLGVATLTTAVLLFGLTPSPGIDVIVRLAPDPLNPRQPDHYLLSSPLGFLAAWPLDVHSAAGYAMMHFVAVVAAVASMVAMVRVYVSDVAARFALFAWFASPLSAYNVTWLGQPDPVTVFAATAVTVGPGWLCVVGGLLLGFNHFEQGVFIVVAAGVVRLALRHEPVGRLAPILAGLFVGRVLLAVYLYAAEASPSRLSYIAEHGVGGIARQAVSSGPVLLWSLFGVLWVPVAVLLYRTDARSRGWLLAVGGVLLAAVTVTTDQTRVWALIAWPLLIYAAEWWSAQPRQRWLVPFLAAACVLPRVVVWAGEPGVIAR